MICPPYKVCNEQATGPVCVCPPNKVGTFCQYGNLKTYFQTYSFPVFFF